MAIDKTKAKPSIKSRQCMFVLYPESQQSIIDYVQNNFPCAWALHDKDTWEKDGDGHKKGDLKKPHIHFVCKFSNPRHFSGIAKELGIPVEAINRCNNLYKAYVYLWHKDTPEKYQYSPDIVGVHDFDVPSETFGVCAEEDEQIRIMLDMPVFQDVEAMAKWAYENGCWKVLRDNYHMWRDIQQERKAKDISGTPFAPINPRDKVDPGFKVISPPDVF